MKNILSFFAMLIITMALAQICFAEVKPESFSFTPIFGGYSFDNSDHLKARPVYGLRAGYNFTGHLGMEALFDYVPTKYSGSSANEGDVNVYGYGIDFLYHFMPESSLVPYVALGYGGRTIDPDNLSSDTRGIFDYGVGAEYFLTDALALRGDFRHLLLRRDEMLNNLEYTMGLTFHFGGKKSAPETASTTKTPPLKAPAAQATPGRYKYCIPLNIEFDIDRALIRPEYHDEVAKVGDFMKSYPTTTAVIEGNTDNVGTFEYNMALSKRRAESIVNYLTEKFSIDPSRLTAEGYGYTRPVAENNTYEGRQENRHSQAIIDCTFDTVRIQPTEQLCMLIQIEFDTGKADIKPQYRDEIAKISDYLKKHPKTTALIEGHTDNIGSPEYNMKLSQERADNVVNYLVEIFGIERSRLTAKGYGDTRRIDYNSSPEGRQRNRRINAVIGCSSE